MEPFVEALNEMFFGDGLLDDKFVAVLLLDGDMEYRSNTLRLAHFNGTYPCDFCLGCRRGTNNINDARPNAKWKSTMVTNNSLPTDHPYARIIGIRRFHAKFDWMHTADLGPALDVCGCALHEYTYLDRRTTRSQAEANLAELWEDIQTYQNAMETPDRLSQLHISAFIDPDKPWDGVRVLKSSAAQTRNLLPAILYVLEKRDSGSDLDALRLMMVRNLVGANNILKSAGFFLTAAQAKTFQDCVENFCLYYSKLSVDMARHGKQLYNYRFKHHAMLHIAMEAKFENPRVSWCYGYEDQVGKICRGAHSCCFGTAKARVMSAYFRGYRVLCWVRWSRMHARAGL